MTIFGRTTEPALVVGAIVALVSLAGTLGFSFLGPEQAGLWIALINAAAAAIMAWATRPISPGVFTYLVSTIIALATSYGLDLPAETVNGINAVVVPFLALLTRGQVSPVNTGLTKSTEAVGKPEVQTVPGVED